MKVHGLKTLLLLVSVALLTVPAFSLSEESGALTMEGQLMRVDPDARIFVVHDAEGNPVEFSYDESTEIAGGAGTVEGLAGESGTRVKVQYRKDGSVNFAILVQIQPQA